MNKENTKKKLSGTGITHLAKFFIIVIFIFSSLAAADAQSKAGAENKNTAKYQGTLSGEWGGEVMSTPVSGTFSITILADGTVSGTFSGIQSGTITGTISSKGEINAKGSAGIAEWNGQVSVKDGHLSGSGTWEGYGGDGKWNSK